MGGGTKIEWTDASWNPVTGCSPISPGCDNCYAKRMAKRMHGRCGYPEGAPFAVTLHLHRLGIPDHWRKSKRIFVCSMGDLFHDKVSFSFISKVMEVAESLPRHTFQLLTKRPQMMLDWCTEAGYGPENPLPGNIWAGVTTENQDCFDERVHILMKVPASIRYISAEPLLSLLELRDTPLSWVICGGETGPKARRMHSYWAIDLLDQCNDAEIPFFFKKWGPGAGRNLDGKEWNQFPEAR